MASSRKIRLQSSDGEFFEVDQWVMADSVVINDVIEVCPNDNMIPLPNLPSKILAKVIDYCKKHEELKAYDVDFVDVDKAKLDELYRAADYLNIKSLLDLTSQKLADKNKAETPEEINTT